MGNGRIGSEITKSKWNRRIKNSGKSLKPKKEFLEHPRAQYIMTFTEWKNNKKRKEIFSEYGYKFDGITKL